MAVSITGSTRVWVHETIPVSFFSDRSRFVLPNLVSATLFVLEFTIVTLFFEESFVEVTRTRRRHTFSICETGSARGQAQFHLTKFYAVESKISPKISRIALATFSASYPVPHTDSDP